MGSNSENISLPSHYYLTLPTLYSNKKVVALCQSMCTRIIEDKGQILRLELILTIYGMELIHNFLPPSLAQVPNTKTPPPVDDRAQPTSISLASATVTCLICL